MILTYAGQKLIHARQSAQTITQVGKNSTQGRIFLFIDFFCHFLLCLESRQEEKMAFETGMNEEQRASVSGALSKVLADTFILYLKTLNFHWNYNGVEFYPFHLLFQKQYEEMIEGIDEMAERVRALGFFVDGTADAFKKLSSIKEEHRVVSAHEMVEQLLAGHEVVIRELRNLSYHAEKHRDPATVDLCGRRLNAHEKFAWMLRSSLR